VKGGWKTSVKSSNQLRREIRLRQSIRESQHSIDDHTDGWGRLADERNRELLRRAETELAAVTDDLEWEFDGEGVYDGRIAMGRLVDLAGPLGRAFRGTARDLLFLDGRRPGAALQDLTEPVVAGTFSGSFGLRISASPVAEQLTLEGPLFDRTASRIVDIFSAARVVDGREGILENLGGLRESTLRGFQRLSEQLAAAGRSSIIRWQGETVVTVPPEAASTLAATIAEAHPSERDETIEAVLIGADLSSGRFHLEAQQVTGPQQYTGKADPDAVAELRGVKLGTRVSATLLVIELESPLLEEPKASYVLQRITESEDEPAT